MEKNKLHSIIESLLFSWGEPLSIKKMSEVLDISYGDTKTAVYELQKDFEAQSRGIQIIEVNSSFQLATRRENYSYIEKLCKRSKSKGLSQASMEVMAIIAYHQPITRHEIEVIRGVSSDRGIKILLEKELIEVRGHLEQVGRPVIYGTTDVFLKCFGFKSIKELPVIEEFQQINMFELENGDDV